jgi:hypothetical protein
VGKACGSLARGGEFVQNLVGKSKGKRLPGRCRHRYGDNI